MKRSVGRLSDSIAGWIGLLPDEQTFSDDQQTFSEANRSFQPFTELLTRRTDLFRLQVTRATLQQSSEPRKGQHARQSSHLQEEQICSAGERIYRPIRWPSVQGVELSSPLQLSSLAPVTRSASRAARPVLISRGRMGGSGPRRACLMASLEPHALATGEAVS